MKERNEFEGMINGGRLTSLIYVFELQWCDILSSTNTLEENGIDR
jgi:hypothetical protein